MGDLLKYHERARLMFASPAISGGTELLILLCLSDYSDGGERAVWPAVSTLASRCNLSDRTVRRALRGLQASGLLEAEERRGTTTRYRIAWSLLSPDGLSISPGGEDESYPGQNDKGATDCTPDKSAGVDPSTTVKMTAPSGQDVRGDRSGCPGGSVILAADRFTNGEMNRDNEACALSGEGSLSFLDEVIS